MGTSSRYADWRHGRGRGDFRFVLSRAHRRSLECKRDCGGGATDVDWNQLFRGARRQQRPERSYVAKNRGDRGTGSHWIYCWRSCPAALDSVAGRTILI
jgi:hypothetical protein